MSKQNEPDTQEEERQKFYAFRNAYGSDPAEADKMLAEDRSLLNVSDGSGESVLHWFVIETVLPTVQWLLERGAEVNTRDCADSTPLIDAASLGHVEMCRLLLDHGADLTVRNHTEENALSAAVSSIGNSERSQEKQTTLVVLLLEHLGKDEDINGYFDKWQAEEALAREDRVATLLLQHGLQRPSWPEYDEDGC